MDAYPTPPPSPTCSEQRRIINGRLEIIGELGIGAYGVVYTAVDCLDPRRTYAVKALRKQGLEPRQQKFQDLEISLHEEASRSQHPNIVEFVQIMEDHEYKYVILEYCPEGDLFSNITDRGRYVRDDEMAKSVFLQIIDAVSHCHSLGIYHRDLKPENILVTDGGNRVKLADFGLATKDRITSDYGCGSTFYMSPECQQSSPRPFASYESAANDIWSLGVILVNLTCGRNPWKRASVEDSTYSAYLEDRSFLNTILPITDELNAILSMIFDPNPLTRITLPALRQLIADCPKFTISQQPTVSPVPVLQTIHNIPAHPPSPQLMPYDPGYQHVDIPLCVPHSPPLTPPLCATPVSWTQNIATHSVSNFQQHGCNGLAGAYSSPASRSPVLPQSHCAIVQPVPTKVHAFPPSYAYNEGYHYWIPAHSRMVSYFQQPFQHHLQQLRPVYAC